MQQCNHSWVKKRKETSNSFCIDIILMRKKLITTKMASKLNSDSFLSFEIPLGFTVTVTMVWVSTLR